MEDAKAVGIRTDGVYVQTNGGLMTKQELGKTAVVMGQTYGLIRFCPNGMVLSSSTVAPANSLKALTEKIGDWFYCDSGLSALSRSAFRVNGDKVTYRARSLQGTSNTTLVAETTDAGFEYLKVTHSVKFKSRTKIKGEIPDFWRYAFFPDAE